MRPDGPCSPCGDAWRMCGAFRRWSVQFGKSRDFSNRARRVLLNSFFLSPTSPPLSTTTLPRRCRRPPLQPPYPSIAVAAASRTSPPSSTTTPTAVRAPGNTRTPRQRRYGRPPRRKQHSATRGEMGKGWGAGGELIR